MFILQDEIKVWWPVKVKVPDEKSLGRFIEHTFDAEFLLIDRDQANARDDQRAELLSSDGDPKDIVRALQAFDDETYCQIVSDWKGVLDKQKREVPFSHALLIQALKQPLVRAAFERAYAELTSGEVRRKN